MIPYGADIVRDAPIEPIEAMGLKQNGYFVSIGRIEPENSVLEMVTAYAMRKRRAAFVCVGKLDPNNNAYHAQVITASKGRVLFPGAIYDPDRVRALRFHALAYCHGHTVGGTNPSLVEALGAGNAVIAHNNPFNNWVAGSGQFYFSDVMSCDQAMTLLDTKPELAEPARMRAKSRHSEAFMWSGILQAYEELCLKFTPERKRSHQRRGCNDQVPSCGDHRSDEAGQSLDNI